MACLQAKGVRSLCRVEALLGSDLVEVWDAIVQHASTCVHARPGPGYTLLSKSFSTNCVGCAVLVGSLLATLSLWK